MSRAGRAPEMISCLLSVDRKTTNMCSNLGLRQFVSMQYLQELVAAFLCHLVGTIPGVSLTKPSFSALFVTRARDEEVYALE